MAEVISIVVPQRFDLAKAVFSYGWALLAPNRWLQGPGDAEARGLPCFVRPLHTSSGRIVTASISQPYQEELQIKVDHEVLVDEQEDLISQVRRMLRLGAEDKAAVEGFQKLHAKAREKCFGRLLRSPDVWEDLVKCILLCNCGWGRTVSMNQALCQKIGSGAFPSAADVAAADLKELQHEAGLGYRAKSLSLLAQKIQSGDVDLHVLEDPGLEEHDLMKQLLALPGIGPFSAANMLQLLGRYERIACDSETVRHFRDHRKQRSCTAGNVEAVAQKLYKEYAPYQFLAYWHELWHSYEQLQGPFSELTPDQYTSFTGRNMTQHLKGVQKKTTRTRKGKRVRD